MSHNEKPEHSPVCCGRQAKWVVISPSLAYFYCEKCKKEVVGSNCGKNDDDGFENLFGDIADSTHYALPSLPHHGLAGPQPSKRYKYSSGDTVVSNIGRPDSSLITKGQILTIIDAYPSAKVRYEVQDANGDTWIVSEQYLDLVPGRFFKYDIDTNLMRLADNTVFTVCGYSRDGYLLKRCGALDNSTIVVMAYIVESGDFKTLI